MFAQIRSILRDGDLEKRNGIRLAVEALEDLQNGRVDPSHDIGVLRDEVVYRPAKALLNERVVLPKVDVKDIGRAVAGHRHQEHVVRLRPDEIQSSGVDDADVGIRAVELFEYRAANLGSRCGGFFGRNSVSGPGHHADLGGSFRLRQRTRSE